MLIHSQIHMVICDVCVVSYQRCDITYSGFCLQISSFLQQIFNHWEMTFGCSKYQWSPSKLIHSHMYIHVWRMCGFTSMVQYHLLDHSSLQYQLLSPPNIQPSVNNLSLQQTSMEWIHSDTFTGIFMCDVWMVSHPWYDITYSICLHISSFLHQIFNRW